MSSIDTEAADIDFLLDRLGHGIGTAIQRRIVKQFREQLILAGMMEAIRVHSIGAPTTTKKRRQPS